MTKEISQSVSIAILVSLWIMTGCSVHSVNVSPEPLVSAEEFPTAGSAEAQPANESWWKSFNDEKLNTLIQTGLENNYDVLQAVARLAQASALSRQSEAARLPQIGLAADGEQIWREGSDRENLTRIGAAFSWEVDVFNRLESISLARQSEQRARRDDVEAVRLRLSAEIAGAYFDAVGWRNQLALLEKQIIIDRDLLELTRLRYESGLTASVDMLQQSSQLAETESLVPPVEAALRVSEKPA